MKFSLEVKYKIGEEIKWDNGILKVIGYNYVETRGLQYILLTCVGGKTDWLYLYDFEIAMIKK